MKKSLFAIAALTALAGTAQAQSSVTVYGILDVGYVGGTSRATSSATTSNGGQTKGTFNQFGQSAEQTSRLGFKGSEDLGNGMQAFFTVEFGLAPQDQLVSGNTNGGLQNRQAFVGLHKNGIGQVASGLQYTPVFNAAVATDVGGFNNVTGNLIFASSTGITSSSAGTNNIALTNRTANTLSVKSDNFKGFTVSGIYALNNKNNSAVDNSAGVITSGGNTNASGWGLGADYTLNKFYAAAAYQALKQVTSANQGPTATDTSVWTTAQPNGATAAPLNQVAGTSAAAGSAQNINDNQFYAGATYDFGILKAYAQYINRKATSNINTGYYLSRTAEQIGVRSFITPTIEGWASAGLGRYTAYGLNQPTANFNGWQLGSNYWLSKRTNLYAIYGQTLISNTAAAGVTASGGLSNYAIGVRHTF